MTETTMVEKVARAMCVSAGINPDGAISVTITGDGTSAAPRTATVLRWQGYGAMARAAIEAMREENLVYAALEPQNEGDEISGRRWFSGDSGNWLWLWRRAMDIALEETNE